MAARLRFPAAPSTTINGNLEYGKQAGNVAAYVDLGETHEAGWRDLQSSDIQNFYGDLGWRNDHASLHINLTMANSVLNGPGTVPVQILDVDPSAQFTGPNQIADKYLKFGTSFNDQLTADTSLQVVGLLPVSAGASHQRQRPV